MDVSRAAVLDFRRVFDVGNSTFFVPGWVDLLTKKLQFVPETYVPVILKKKAER